MLKWSIKIKKSSWLYIQSEDIKSNFNFPVPTCKSRVAFWLLKNKCRARVKRAYITLSAPSPAVCGTMDHPNRDHRTLWKKSVDISVTFLSFTLLQLFKNLSLVQFQVIYLLLSACIQGTGREHCFSNAWWRFTVGIISNIDSQETSQCHMV